jgi:hypothetical protein
VPGRALKGTRALAVTLLVSVALVGVWACGDDTIVPMGDAGGADATLDITVDAESEAEAESEASCAVDAGQLDDAEIQLGETIISTHRCFICHGQTLGGNNDGVAFPQDEGGFAYPPNLTSDPATGLGCWTNAQIERAILDGIDNEGMPLCPPMPRFGHLDDGGLDAAQVQAVIEYLRSIPVYVNQVPNTNCTFSDAGPEAAPPEEAGPGDAGGDAADATLGDAGEAGDAADASDATTDVQEAGGD